MITLGIDIGSRTVKTVLFDDALGEIISCAVSDNTILPAETAQKLVNWLLKQEGLTREEIDFTLSTGYGRNLISFADAASTEITCHATGVNALLPASRLIIDIGGQDSKVIKISNSGKVLDFIMNDRCAAGTGRFLEVAARILNSSLPEFVSLSSNASESPEISSMCAVFAESEIHGMISRGTSRENIAAGLHSALARRIAGLVRKCGFATPVAFTGGVARNSAMVRAINSELKERVVVPPDPRITGALGAALLAARKLQGAGVLKNTSQIKTHTFSHTDGKSTWDDSPLSAACASSCNDCTQIEQKPTEETNSNSNSLQGLTNSVPSLARFSRMIENSIDYAKEQKKRGAKIVSIFCEYTPRELILAAGAIPVCMCGGSNRTAKRAEDVLPSNLCPLIKSSYGYALDGSNQLLEMTDLIVAETTCDGKKKMFELLGKHVPIHVLELTQKPDEEVAFEHWHTEVRALAKKLEDLTGNSITQSSLSRAIEVMNEERKLRLAIAKHAGSGLSGSEVLMCKSLISGIPEDLDAYKAILHELEGAKSSSNKPRVILTGVPLPHGAEKVIRIIEQCGGEVIFQENCTGVKPLVELIPQTDDPLKAIASKYFHLPCSCMTPNVGRLDLIKSLAQAGKANCVIDLVWQACHTYNVESVDLKRYCEEELKLPLLKIETDYSPSDSEQIKLRVEAFLAMQTQHG